MREETILMNMVIFISLIITCAWSSIMFVETLKLSLQNEIWVSALVEGALLISLVIFAFLGRSF